MDIARPVDRHRPCNLGLEITNIGDRRGRLPYVEVVSYGLVDEPVEVAQVEAVKQGFVVTEGAMEYSKEIGIRMQMIEELMAT